MNDNVSYEALPFSDYYYHIIDVFACFLTVLLVVNVHEIRTFLLLPVRQVGSFSILYTKCSVLLSVALIGLMVLFSVALVILNSISEEKEEAPLVLMQFRMTWALLALPCLIYVAYKQRHIYREVCRRTSLLHVSSRHTNVDYYNAEKLCEEFHLDIFPVKTYEDLYRESPDKTSLSLLHEKLTLAHQHDAFIKEVSSSTLHILAIEKTHKPLTPMLS